MIDEKKASSRHKIVMDRRKNAAVSGVLEVISFDEETIIAETEMGILIIRGVNLHVNKLNLENGDLEVEGDILSLNYEEHISGGKGKNSFFGGLFK